MTRDALMYYINNHTQSNIYQLSDGLNYQIPTGKFTFTYKNKTIYINITKDLIYISAYNDMNILKEFINEIYNDYHKKDNVLYFHTSNNGVFKLGLPKRPRIFHTLTPSMNDFMDNIKNFMHSDTIDDYKNKGLPHRCGYLIHGIPGTGKSAIVEKIALDYNMNLMLLYLMIAI